MTNFALAFQATSFEVVLCDDQPWLRGYQIGTALGYSQAGQSIAKLFDRYAEEFTDQMTTLVDLDTGGGKQTVRIFSLRGTHLLAMLARTTVAKDFRKWVLDFLDRQIAPQSKPASLSHEQRKHLALTTRNFTHSAHWNPDQSLNFDAALQTISDFEKFLVVCDSHGLQTGNLTQCLLYHPPVPGQLSQPPAARHRAGDPACPAGERECLPHAGERSRCAVLRGGRSHEQQIRKQPDRPGL